jgi:hypothetical protein
MVNVASAANLMIEKRHMEVNCVAAECGIRNQFVFRSYNCDCGRHIQKSTTQLPPKQ